MPVIFNKENDDKYIDALRALAVAGVEIRMETTEIGLGKPVKRTVSLEWHTGSPTAGDL